MSLRFISRTVLAAALCAVPLHAALAADATTQQQAGPRGPGGDDDDDRPVPPPGGGNFGGEDDGPPPPPPGGGNFGGGGGFQGGGFGGGGGNFGGGPGQGQGALNDQRGGFGAPRGGFGAPRGVLGPAFMGFDAVRANETADQRRQRLLQPYLAMLPTLSAAQQTHILAILDAISAELRAANADTTLSPQQRASAARYLRSDLSNRIALALTPEQVPTFNAQLVQQNPQGGGFGPGQGQGGAQGFGGEGGGFGGGGFGGEGGAGGGESIEELRTRLLAGYEDVMDELSVKEKTDILAILKTADAQATNVRADTTKSVAAKTDALQAIHDEVNAKVLPLLDAEQAALWKKAHAAKRLQLAKLAATPLPPQQQPQPQQGPGGSGPQPGGWVGF